MFSEYIVQANVVLTAISGMASFQVSPRGNRGVAEIDVLACCLHSWISFDNWDHNGCVLVCSIDLRDNVKEELAPKGCGR